MLFPNDYLSHKNWIKRLDLLHDTIRMKAPELKHLLGRIGAESLSDDEVQAINDFLMREFLSHGLQPDDEPNQHGKDLDELMGFVQALARDF